jgi:predicted GH43/DUF377 family glycosyl hydrolase
VIFPEKFDGLYARLDRPHSEIAPWSIWISYSPDLRFWGESQLVMKPEPYHWDEINVVFTCGAVAESDGTVKIYWGGADTVMCVGEANVSDLVALCMDHPRPSK